MKKNKIDTEDSVEKIIRFKKIIRITIGLLTCILWLLVLILTITLLINKGDDIKDGLISFSILPCFMQFFYITVSPSKKLKIYKLLTSIVGLGISCFMTAVVTKSSYSFDDFRLDSFISLLVSAVCVVWVIFNIDLYFYKIAIQKVNDQKDKNNK